MMAKRDAFILSNTPTQHILDTPMGELIVNVKQLSWVEQQDAMSRFVSFKTEMMDPLPQTSIWGAIGDMC